MHTVAVLPSFIFRSGNKIVDKKAKSKKNINIKVLFKKCLDLCLYNRHKRIGKMTTKTFRKIC